MHFVHTRRYVWYVSLTINLWCGNRWETLTIRYKIINPLHFAPDNPCPNLGNIVTIKLSENIENVLQTDDTYLTMLSEMHFQMNYNNGQWTRLKKYRHIDGMLPQKIPPGSTVIQANNQQPVVSIANQSVS